METPSSPNASPVTEEPLYPLPPRYKEAVIDADIIVLGTVTDVDYEEIQVGEGEYAGKQVYTITTLTVEKVLKGDPGTKQVLFRTEGGIFEDGVEQFPRQKFEIGHRLLYYALEEWQGDQYVPANSGGILWAGGGNIYAPPVKVCFQDTVYRLDILEDVMEIVIKLMKENNIPVAGTSPNRILMYKT
jgi:hypothetical protein